VRRFTCGCEYPPRSLCCPRERSHRPAQSCHRRCLQKRHTTHLHAIVPGSKNELHHIEQPVTVERVKMRSTRSVCGSKHGKCLLRVVGVGPLDECSVPVNDVLAHITSNHGNTHSVDMTYDRPSTVIFDNVLIGFSCGLATQHLKHDLQGPLTFLRIH
jgi:hypothetical protein